MGSIFLQASVLRNIVLLSVISVSLCDTSNMDDFDSSDAAAAARRLLQKTVYNMPKLNFCELVQTKMSQMRLILFVCSETSIYSRFHMRNVRHRLRFQAAEFTMLRVVSFFCQKMFPNSGTNHSDIGSSEIAESNRIYEPVSVWRQFHANVLSSYIEIECIPAVDFGAQQFSQCDSNESPRRLWSPRGVGVMLRPAQRMHRWWWLLFSHSLQRSRVLFKLRVDLPKVLPAHEWKFR